MASQNLLGLFINDIATLLQYRPLEMATKLKALFTQEFDRISFYDLQLYSDITKDLLIVFKEKDDEDAKNELGSGQSLDAS